MEKDQNEILYGEEASNQIKRFEEGLKKIEERHLEWFKVRENDIDSEDHDRLSNYYMITWNASGITFTLRKDSVLPEFIKKESLDLFKELFNC